MPIKPATPPDQLIATVIARIRSLPTTGPHFLADISRAKLELVAPHRVYALPFDAIGDRELARAVPVGWRLLLVSGDQVEGAVEVGVDGESVAVDSGPFAQSTAAALDDLEALVAANADSFELRLLRINALYVVAAWLAGQDSIVVPLEPAPLSIEAGRAYSEREFFDAVAQPGMRPARS